MRLFTLTVVAVSITAVLFGNAVPLRGEDPVKRAESVELDVDSRTWVDMPTPEPGTPEGDLGIARALHTGGRHRQALKAVKKWIKAYGEDHDLYPAVALLQGEVRIARRDYYKAHVHLEKFLNQFAGTEFEDAALNMEFVIAEVFIGGTKRKFLGIPMLNATDIGLAILDDISANHPGTRIAELATLTKAQYYDRSGDFAFAEQEYTFLVQNFPRSRYVRPAMLRAAHAALASFPGIQFDDASLIEAEEQFNRYLAQFPGSAEQEGIGQILDGINEQRAAKELDIGRYYERTKQPRAARFYYRSTIENWPGTLAALRAEERLNDLGAPIERQDDAAPSKTDVSLDNGAAETTTRFARAS